MTRIAILLLLALLPDERALRLYERTKFQPPNPEDDTAKRVCDLLLKKEHWVGAYSELAEKFGRFPDDLDVTVDFNYTGTELARAAGKARRGVISFNLKKLSESQKKNDEFEELRKTSEAQGRKFYFRVPPARFDRVIYHELTHVLQQGYDAPLWFLEGMAQLAGDDMNAICGFAVEKKVIQDVDAPVREKADTYARGHLFWKWLVSQRAMEKVVELTIFKQRPWKEALEEATARSWASIVATEREWSEKEIEKHR
jgi:hypothetical protein